MNRAARAEEASPPSAPVHRSMTRIYLQRSANARYRLVLSKLLEEYKAGRLTAYRYSQPGQSLPYAQLQALLGDRISSPDPVLELMENGDMGRNLKVTYLKIRWGGPWGESVLFRWDDRLKRFLNTLRLSNPQNEAATLSARQLLEIREFEGRPGYDSSGNLLPD